MRALIVDDEAPARSKLRRMLDAFADVEVVGEAADGGAALSLAAELRPDVIFLDVQMPEVDGFDVAASLPDDGPAIVFVTAFDRYALQAFDTHACDYLLKPVEPERLERAIARLRASAALAGARRRRSAADAAADRRSRRHARCALRRHRMAAAADNYVNVHLKGRSLLMRRTLESLLKDLGPAFVRTHRSAAVALAACTRATTRQGRRHRGSAQRHGGALQPPASGGADAAPAALAASLFAPRRTRFVPRRLSPAASTVGCEPRSPTGRLDPEESLMDVLFTILKVAVVVVLASR